MDSEEYTVEIDEPDESVKVGVYCSDCKHCSKDRLETEWMIGCLFHSHLYAVLIQSSPVRHLADSYLPMCSCVTHRRENNE